MLLLLFGCVASFGCINSTYFIGSQKTRIDWAAKLWRRNQNCGYVCRSVPLLVLRSECIKCMSCKATTLTTFRCESCVDWDQTQSNKIDKCFGILSSTQTISVRNNNAIKRVKWLSTRFVTHQRSNEVNARTVSVRWQGLPTAPKWAKWHIEESQACETWGLWGTSHRCRKASALSVLSLY